LGELVQQGPRLRCIENPKAVDATFLRGRTGKVPTKVYKSHYFKKGLHTAHRMPSPSDILFLTLTELAVVP
jgi:hypothetical protein